MAEPTEKDREILRSMARAILRETDWLNLLSADRIEAEQIIAAHVADAVRPFAQAIVDGFAVVDGKGYACQHCAEVYVLTDDYGWQVTHAPGCIVPLAQRVLEGK